MLTHKIVVQNVPTRKESIVTKKKHSKRDRFEGVLGSHEHKMYILARAFKDCKFEVKDKVKYKGQIWEISQIYDEDYFDYIDWNGLAPLFIELWRADGEMQMVNPGTLKRANRR